MNVSWPQYKSFCLLFWTVSMHKNQASSQLHLSIETRRFKCSVDKQIPYEPWQLWEMNAIVSPSNANVRNLTEVNVPTVYRRKRRTWNNNCLKNKARSTFFRWALYQNQCKRYTNSWPTRLIDTQYLLLLIVIGSSLVKSVLYLMSCFRLLFGGQK